MKLSNKPQSSIISTLLLLFLLLGSSQLVWTKPAFRGAEVLSSVKEFPQTVQHGENFNAGKIVFTRDSKGLSVDTRDGAKMAQGAQSDHEDLHSPEIPNRVEHSNDVRKDNLAFNGARAEAQPILAQEGCWTRLKNYLRGVWNKLLSLFKSKTATDAQLLQQNMLKEYMRRRYGVGKRAEAALVDNLGLHSPEPPLSLKELFKKAREDLFHDQDARESRWSKTPSWLPEANVGGLSDLEKKERAIQVEIAAIREEVSLMGSLISLNEAEANQRLRIARALHALAERYRAAIVNPATATIALHNIRPYTKTLDEWYEQRKTFGEIYVKYETKRIRDLATAHGETEG